MADQILMPKATAVWLVDNTSMTFEQIADFAGLHPLEVKGIADGEVARDIRGADPIANGQLTREELDKAQNDPSYRMKAQKSRHAELLKPAKKAPRYTPVSRRQDRPDAISWFLKNHPEGDYSKPILTPDAVRLVHKATVEACDTLDGVKDGVINDPRQCKFDVASLVCKAGDPEGQCLAGAERRHEGKQVRGGVRDRRAQQCLVTVVGQAH